MSELEQTEERIVEGEVSEKLFAEHAARYSFAAPLVRGRRVLDMACGTGYGAPILLAGGATEVVGVDLNADAVEYARKRYGNDAISFHQGDACAPPKMVPFGAIVSFETIEHLQTPHSLLRACGNLLLPGGVFLVSSPYRHRVDAHGKPRNRFHVHEWRTDEFAALLRGYFADVAIYGQLLKVESRFGLSRKLAYPIARSRGRRPGDPTDIYPLPGPRLFGIWNTFPAYLIAVCRTPCATGFLKAPKADG